MLKTERGDVVGVFTDRADMDRARDELMRAGFRQEDVATTTPDGANEMELKIERKGLLFKGGAEFGGIVGGVIGLLIGTLLGSGAVSAWPPLLGGGAVGATVGALIGLVVGACLGALIGWGMAADTDSFYARELQSGRCLMTVHGGQPTTAADIMRRNRAARVNVPR
jgi:hypothetical protein